jgi:hypothetical protein
MKHAALVIALAGCNQIYGLDQTRLVDARPIDPPPTCQPALEFTRRLQQVTYQECIQYVPATDVDYALAYCRDDSRGYIADGKIDGLLSEVAVDQRFAGSVPSQPRLAPEGDRAVIFHSITQGNNAYSVHHRDSTGWRFAYDLPIVYDFDDSVGVPSRSPRAHILHAIPNAGLVEEFVEDAPGVWRLLFTYKSSELATQSLYTQFNLTPDGLQVLYQGAFVEGYAIYHAWRGSLDEKFGPGVAVEGIARTVQDAFMTENCARIYFSGLSSIFYAEQR